MKKNKQIKTVVASSFIAISLTGLTQASMILMSSTTSNVNLTTQGVTDWKIWSDSTTATLTESDRKLGGVGLGALSFSGASAFSTGDSSVSLAYTWTDGTNQPSVLNLDNFHLSSGASDETAVFSTSIASSVVSNTLYVSFGQFNFDSIITATLGDGTTESLSFTANDHQTVKIDFDSDAADILDVTVGVIAGSNTNSTNAQIRFESLALLNPIAVPEPSSTTLLGLGGLALILRRRK